MSKLPYFPCYARDVLSSSKIALMGGDAFKAYWLLLCASWLEDERATLPNNEAKLEALARVDASTWLKIKNEVLACFDTAGNGRLFSPRLLEVSLLQEKRREAGSKGGSKTQAGDEATHEANFKQTTKRQSQRSESELKLEAKSKKNKSSASGDAAKADEIFILTRRKRKLKGELYNLFNEFWEAFGDKRARAEAADAWIDINWPKVENINSFFRMKILPSAQEYCRYRKSLLDNGQTPKMAQGWISGQRWDDVIPKELTFEEALAKAREGKIPNE